MAIGDSRGVTRATTALVIGAVLVGACAGPPGSTARNESTNDPTSTTASSVSSPKPGQESERGPYRAQGDVDGDGKPDRISVEEIDSDQARIVVDTSSQGRLQVELRIYISPVLYGTSDVNGDGQEEIFYRVGGASMGMAALVVLHRGELRQVRGPDGAEFEFLFGDAMSGSAGAQCRNDTLRLTSFARDVDTGTPGWEQSGTVQTATYRLRGERMVELGRTESRAESEPPGLGIGGIDCSGCHRSALKSSARHPSTDLIGRCCG